MKLKTLILCTAMTGALMVPAIAKAADAPAPAPAAAAEAAKPAQPPEHKGPNGGKMFEEADANKDGKLSKEEFLARHEKKFAEIDTNKDGALTQDEMKSYGDSMREKFHSRMEERKEKGPEGKSGEKAPEPAPAH